jgi:heme O synthase-like polyprenyltransferase
VSTEIQTRRSIVLYSVVLLVVSLIPTLWFGPVYGIGAALLGATLLWMAWRGLNAEGHSWAAALFHFSLAYLALMFALASLGAVLSH